MFQKFAIAFKAKTLESVADDEKAAGGDSSDGVALLNSAEEVITGQRVVVIKPDRCRAAPVPAQSHLPEPNLLSAKTLGRELERAYGLSPESTRLAKKPWREQSRASRKMGSGKRERGRETSAVGCTRAYWRHVSIAEWSAPTVTWKGRAFRTFFLKSYFDFLSNSEEKLKAKKEMPGSSFAAFIAAFVAPVVLSMIAYEHLHKKKASNCEVFLSFSTEDALKNFTDSLYKGMVDEGIRVFRKDYCLRQHEKIGLQAIKSGKILIPILSPKYASSRQCLDELVQIMECNNDSSGHVIWPIFYRVEPADVRCEIDVCDPVVAEERKRALKEISSLKRWESDKITAGDDGQLVELVVRKVLIELKKALEPVITENSVGIKSSMEKIMNFVDSRGSTLYVGIYGESGVASSPMLQNHVNAMVLSTYRIT
ncbi:hypothetical protein BT93_B1208 [Corymbia citriodora subsp. variegata]|nr:hypothetical protein BT93_B1208 [Corymbia citriodora subsp. variegata]